MNLCFTKVDEDKLAPGETSPVTRQAVLSDEEAARYTYEAVTAGTDDWYHNRELVLSSDNLEQKGLSENSRETFCRKIL